MTYKNKFDLEKQLEKLRRNELLAIVDQDESAAEKARNTIMKCEESLAKLKEAETKIRSEDGARKKEAHAQYLERVTAEIRGMDPKSFERRFTGAFVGVARLIHAKDTFEFGDPKDFGRIQLIRTNKSKRVRIIYEMAFLNKRLSVITFALEPDGIATFEHMLRTITVKNAVAEKYLRLENGGWDTRIPYDARKIVEDILECFETLFSELDKR